MERARRIAKEVLTVGLLALALFSARSSLADHYVVPTSSMEYTLMPGDRVLVNKLAYGLRVPFIGWRLISGVAPVHGEVVVFDSPESGKRLIKRVVAVGGDVVQIRRGKLIVNNQSYALPDDPETEDFGGHQALLNLTSGAGNGFGPRTIPDGHVLVMGDYRGNSHDGRMFGSVPAAEIYGRAVAVFLRRGDGFTWRPL